MLVINRILLDLKKKENVPLYIFPKKQEGVIFKKKPTKLLEILRKVTKEPVVENSRILQEPNNTFQENTLDFIRNLKKDKIEDEEYLYYSFLNKSSRTILVDVGRNHSIRKDYIKELLIKHFNEKGLLVEHFPVGCSLKVYKEESGDEQYKEFKVYSLNINKAYEDKNKIELTVAANINHTIFKKKRIEDVKDSNFIIVGNEIVKKKFTKNIQGEVWTKLTNEELRKEGKTNKPKFRFYETYCNLIKKFIGEYLTEDYPDELLIYPDLITLPPKRTGRVFRNNNIMVFGKGNKIYNAAEGMREAGPYHIPNEINDVKLFFIYPDREVANKLYKHFKRGYKHFPGLKTYVGIPVNIAKDLSIKYDPEVMTRIDTFAILEQEINEKLPEHNYNNLLAVVIIPFDRLLATEEQKTIYYKLKEILLRKNIPSQFVSKDKIYSENFHYSLPNIAIAMLAKLGGIPWKLATENNDDLIIGFNIYGHSKKQERVLGSAVYFDNSGQVKNIDAFYLPIENKSSGTIILANMINSIKNSIKMFKEEKGYSPNRIIIHYYKSQNKFERKKLKNEFSIPVIFVEVNDSINTNEICFELLNNIYMPVSGTFTRLSSNEYLLFNNLRYKESYPPKKEEYPIKLKIYNSSDFQEHKNLISQVYEFSRLYWRGLKQKRQPVSTLYAKMLAEFIANFGSKKLPDNNTTRKFTWFL